MEIAQLSLWIRTARPGQPLTDLSAHIRCGNSVVDDPAVDPKAFDWKAQFPSVFERGGFDAVVGNPPYVRQELLSPIKPYLQQHYQTYHGMADLYVYFYERGVETLRPGGRLAFVVTNKWMKAGYAEPLRKFFGEKTWVEQVVDFGHAKQFFKDADVFPSFLVLRRPIEGARRDIARVCVIPRDTVRIDELKNQVETKGTTLDMSSVSGEGWSLEANEGKDLLTKIRARGTPLREYLGYSPLSGIKTGFNEAFLVDSLTRQELIKGDPKARDLIKPYLRGQDISRWNPRWAGLWMIAMKSSGDHPWPWSDKGVEAESIFRHAYPTIFAHLTSFRETLARRQDQGRYWWELRSCAYWEEFARPKITYQEITWQLNWCFDARGTLCNNTAYILPTEDRWLLAVMNSPVSWWYAWRTAVRGKDEALRFIKEFVVTLPIASLPNQNREEVNTMVDGLLTSAESRLATERGMLDWLRVEYEISDPGTRLQDVVSLDSDSLVAEVQRARGKKSRLSAAGLHSLRDEYARTVEPARVVAAEAMQLEYRLHDMVNEAYGLNPEEVRLMWDTAPPRMPIPRPASV